MAYDEALAGRVRSALGSDPAVVERKMFGGLAFMVHGNMCCGIVQDELMVRVGAAGEVDALAHPDARPVDFTGRRMTGMVMVAPAGCATDATLADWVDRGLRFARSLPPKP